MFSTNKTFLDLFFRSNKNNNKKERTFMEDTLKIGIVLKMLHYSDLRELQNDLNALLVLGQEYTANPKTNTALGKVGR
jgi:hypothetical protein